MKSPGLALTDMTPDQLECYRLLCDLMFGAHHLSGPVRDFGGGIAYNHYGELATFDYDTLTRLVVMAHDRCIRASVMSAGPNRVRIGLHKRAGREGHMAQRHPTLEDAIQRARAVDKE